MSFHVLINNVLNNLRDRLRSYAGGMFVDAVYNHQGNMISVIWARYSDGVSEAYNFPVMDGSVYAERVNNGEDLSGYGPQLFQQIYNHMIQVESQQTGRPPAV